MISVVIPVATDERALTLTLRALVPGATSGLIREVLLRDEGASEACRRIANAAGCEWLTPDSPPRAPWLMQVPCGVVPDDGWEHEVARHLERETRAGGCWTSAVMAFARTERGLGARCDEAAVWAGLMLFGRIDTRQVVIVPREGQHQRSGRPALLRVRAFAEG